MRAMARPEDGHAAYEAPNGDGDARYAEVVEKVYVQPDMLLVCGRHGGVDRRTVHHCGRTYAGTWGHTGDPVVVLSIIGDAVSYGNPGTLTLKKRLESNSLPWSMTSGPNTEHGI